MEYCEVCGSNFNICQHHLKTKASGGTDHESNLMTVCSKCHAQIHNEGLNKFVSKYPQTELILKSKGWEKDKFLNKWVNGNYHD